MIGDILVGNQQQYTMVIEYSGENPVYIGEAKAGTLKAGIGWRVKKLTYDGSNVTDVNYADDSINFDKIWDDRADYEYGE